MSENFKLFLDDMLDYCNSQEAGIVKLKAQIQKVLGETKARGSTKLPFDVSKIKWEDRENEKGKFQVSEDYDSLDHKALLKFLNEHVPSKCITSEGWFYWVYPSGAKIGRKLKR